MQRRVEREWLDDLPAEDPAALGSRRDLQRLNTWMGNARTVATQLRRFSSPHRTLVELGAGDGQFMLQVAERASHNTGPVLVILVDKQRLPAERLAGRFHELGWNLQVAQQDVFSLVQQPVEQRWNTAVANLFLHHFTDAQLRILFAGLAERTDSFIAVEPRRSKLALTASRLVGLIGCNGVTRHDAPISVRAGFAGRELSGLWPPDGNWKVEEGRAGYFSHLFVACKLGG